MVEIRLRSKLGRMIDACVVPKVFHMEKAKGDNIDNRPQMNKPVCIVGTPRITYHH